MTLADQRGLIDRADTQLLLGDQVAVLAVRAGWAQVVVPSQPTPLDARGYPVWVPLAQLTTRGPPKASTLATVVTRTAWLESADGTRRVEVSFGTTLPVVARRQTTVELGMPDGRRLWIDRAAIAEHGSSAPALPATASSVLASTRRFLGLPYLWAGTSGFGLDCSGLVYLVYRAHGVTLPRDAEPQSHAGRAVALSKLQPGDLVFFARNGVVHHVAIWAGAGKLIEAPKVGASVRLVALASLPYADELSAARRVLP